MEDPIIPCLPILKLHIVTVLAAVIHRLSETRNGKCLGCCDPLRKSHGDSEIGKLLLFWEMVKLGTEGLAPKKPPILAMIQFQSLCDIK